MIKHNVDERIDRRGSGCKQWDTYGEDVEGSTFKTGGAGFMRMNIACPRSKLVEALNRIAAAVDKLP